MKPRRVFTLSPLHPIAVLRRKPFREQRRRVHKRVRSKKTIFHLRTSMKQRANFTPSVVHQIVRSRCKPIRAPKKLVHKRVRSRRTIFHLSQKLRKLQARYHALEQSHVRCKDTFFSLDTHTRLDRTIIRRTTYNISLRKVQIANFAKILSFIF